MKSLSVLYQHSHGSEPIMLQNNHDIAIRKPCTFLLNLDFIVTNSSLSAILCQLFLIIRTDFYMQTDAR